jgi:hypothetical protein
MGVKKNNIWMKNIILSNLCYVSTNKTDGHDITEILLEVTLNTINQINHLHSYLVLLTTLVVIGIHCTGDCKSIYHTIPTMMAPRQDIDVIEHERIFNITFRHSFNSTFIAVPFCNLQSRARTHAVLVIGLFELLGNPTT